MTSRLSIYNQTSSSDEEFIANFVARADMLASLERRLHGPSPEDGGSHHILIGPRGMGKTSMLRRLAIMINRDSGLSARFVPLNFREEQYNVLRLGDFWRNCGEALAEWADANDQSGFADDLDRELASSAWDGDEAAERRFEAALRRIGRRAILLVDNLDLILDALSPEDNWMLRRSLQAAGGPIILGAATQHLRQASDAEAAFYEFFQPHHLEPLDARETESCMRALARRRGDSGATVVDILDQQPERLLTLHTLTGGNPRVLALIYRLLESAESNAAMADLEILLDQVTPYYKARIEEHQTAQQRAVIDAIALNWDPITTGQLSKVTNIVTTTLSSILHRLRNDGLIEVVPTSGSYNGHQLVERFLNIWYLMRHGTRRAKQKMRWLVAFLTSFYSALELIEIKRRARSTGDAKTWHADYAAAFDEALTLSQAMPIEPGAVRIALSTEDDIRDGHHGPVISLIHEITAHLSREETDASRSKLEELLALWNEPGPDPLRQLIAHSMFGVAILVGRDNPAEELAYYDRLIAMIGDNDDSSLRILLGGAYLNKGITLSNLGEHDRSLAAFDTAILRFGPVDATTVLGIVRTLTAKAMLLTEQRRAEAALACFDEAMELFEAASSPEEVAGSIAQGLIAKTRLFEGDAEDQIYDIVIDRFADSSNPLVRTAVATAYFNKALNLSLRQRYTDGLALLDAWVEHFDGDEAAWGKIGRDTVELYRALFRMRLGLHHEALAMFDAVIERLEHLPDDERFGALFHAIRLKSAGLSHSEDREGELEAYERLIALYDDSDYAADDTDEDRLDNIATVMLNRGVTLGQLGDLRAESAAYDALIERFGHHRDGPIAASIARAFNYKGVTLRTLGERDKAIASYRAALEHFGTPADLEVRFELFRSASNLAFSLDGLDDVPGARAAAARAADLASVEPADADDRKFHKMAMAEIAGLLVDRGGADDAEPVLQRAREQVPVWANTNLAWLCLLADRLDDVTGYRRALDADDSRERRMLDAAIEFSHNNIGLATGHLQAALTGYGDSMDPRFAFELDRLLRLVRRLGHGPALILWSEQSGFVDIGTPIIAAFRAFMEGDERLLDYSPEVRTPAQVMLDRLKKGQAPGSAATPSPSASRQRPRRRTR